MVVQDRRCGIWTPERRIERIRPWFPRRRICIPDDRPQWSPPQAAITLVNTTSGTSDTGATSLAATAANHTTGNLIVAGVAWSNNTTASIPTDTAGNTYVSTGIKASNGTSDHVEIFYAKNIAGNASNVVTAHFSASSTFRRVMVHQYSGCDTTAPFTAGEGGTVTTTSSTTATTTSWTTATANEVLVGFSGSSAGLTVTAGTGYTKELTAIGGDSNSEDRIVSATGTYTAGWTWSTGSQTLWLAAASFAQAGGGGGGATPKELAALGVG